MSVTNNTKTPDVKSTAIKSDKLLLLSAKTWFCIATIGQWFFALYVILFYHISALNGNFEQWNKVLPKGYIPGDLSGNTSTAIHVLLGGIVIVIGPLQFFPIIQQKFKVWHRIMGRIFVFASLVIGLAGLIMVWVRGSVGDLFMHISITISALYLIVFALLTIKFAREKKFKQHRKMALRLFMIANGGWFFRIALIGWIVANRGPVGFDPKTFSGPVLWIISACSYSVPLSIILLELYFYAQEQKTVTIKKFTATIIFLFSLVTAFGILAATFLSWLPRIRG